MMSTVQDSRQGNPNDPESGPERRSSCRYSVDEVAAILSWYDDVESLEETGEPGGDRLPAVDSVSRLKVFDVNTYSAIMARGPVLRGSSPFLQGQKAVVRPGSAAVPAAHPTPSSDSAPAPAPPAESTPAAIKPAAVPALAAVKAAPVHEHPRAEPRPDDPNSSAEPIMQSCQARILDISYTGIRLLSEAIPREGQTVWVRLDGSPVTDWVEGTVRGVSQREPGRFQVRISFRVACPYDFFKTAVYGSRGGDQ